MRASQSLPSLNADGVEQSDEELVRILLLAQVRAREGTSMRGTRSMADATQKRTKALLSRSSRSGGEAPPKLDADAQGGEAAGSTACGGSIDMRAKERVESPRECWRTAKRLQNCAHVACVSKVRNAVLCRHLRGSIAGCHPRRFLRRLRRCYAVPSLLCGGGGGSGHKPKLSGGTLWTCFLLRRILLVVLVDKPRVASPRLLGLLPFRLHALVGPDLLPLLSFSRLFHLPRPFRPFRPFLCDALFGERLIKRARHGDFPPRRPQSTTMTTTTMTTTKPNRRVRKQGRPRAERR